MRLQDNSMMPRTLNLPKVYLSLKYAFILPSTQFGFHLYMLKNNNMVGSSKNNSLGKTQDILVFYTKSEGLRTKWIDRFKTSMWVDGGGDVVVLMGGLMDCGLN